ncbi:MAG: DUF2341 domain-containing protein [bacterium]
MFKKVLLSLAISIFLVTPASAKMKYWSSHQVTTTGSQTWTYYRDIVITNQTAGTLTDYQVKLEIPYDSDMQTDFDDIRITDISNVLLSGQWRETYTASGTETRFVKISTILPSGSVTIRMHYGNASANLVSSVTNTFVREINGAQPLKGAWNLDEGSGTTANDTSGNGNNGTLLPAGTGPTWTTGKFGNALSFDGTDDYVEFSDNSATDFGATDSFTFLLWVKTNQTPSWEARFITFRVGGSQPLIDIGVNSNGTFGLQRARSSSGSGDEVGLSTTNSYNNGQWHHFAVVRDVPADKFRLYVDANLDGEKIDSTTGHFDTVTKRLGFYYDGQYYNGLIDEVQIYKSALTAAEISDLYGTGGDRHGYTTTNYPGRVLVRNYASPEPTYTIGSGEFTSSYSE